MTFVEHRRLRMGGSLSHAGAERAGERERSTAALFFGRPIGRYYCGSGERQHPPFQTKRRLFL